MIWPGLAWGKAAGKEGARQAMMLLRIPEEILQGGDGIANGFGFLAADLDAGPAGDAPLGHDFGLAVFHFDGFGRAFAHAGIAPAAFFLYGGDYGHGILPRLDPLSRLCPADRSGPLPLWPFPYTYPRAVYLVWSRWCDFLPQGLFQEFLVDFGDRGVLMGLPDFRLLSSLYRA